MKKILLFALSLVLAFAFVGCSTTATDSALSSTKNDKIAVLEAYFQENYSESNYTTENWETIKGIVAKAKAKILAFESTFAISQYDLQEIYNELNAVSINNSSYSIAFYNYVKAYESQINDLMVEETESGSGIYENVASLEIGVLNGNNSTVTVNILKGTAGAFSVVGAVMSAFETILNYSSNESDENDLDVVTAEFSLPNRSTSEILEMQDATAKEYLQSVEFTSNLGTINILQSLILSKENYISYKEFCETSTNDIDEYKRLFAIIGVPIVTVLSINAEGKIIYNDGSSFLSKAISAAGDFVMNFKLNQLDTTSLSIKVNSASYDETEYTTTFNFNFVTETEGE